MGNWELYPSVWFFSLEGLPPCRGQQAWVSWRPLELCWWEVRLLVGLSKPDRLKGRGPMKCNPLVLQIRGLGTGLTTLSCKTPVLRKWKNAALHATQHNGHVWVCVVFLTPQVYIIFYYHNWCFCVLLCSSQVILVNLKLWMITDQARSLLTLLDVWTRLVLYCRYTDRGEKRLFEWWKSCTKQS